MTARVQHIVCYIPVLHDGYVRFFADNPTAIIHVLDDSVLRKRFDYLRKDVRALQATDVVRILQGMGRDASVAGEAELSELFSSHDIIMPDDDISRELQTEFHANSVRFSPVFLRWDRTAIEANQSIAPDKTVPLNADDQILHALYDEAGKSTNWWRNVGAAIVDGDKIVAIAHNGSVPTEYSSAIDGDPRITERRGSEVDTSIDLHAEARLISEAAKHGTKLAGKTLYATTFPCASCAKLIATSGISACYFVDGYASIDGQSILKANDVELIKIDAPSRPNNRQRSKKYQPN